MDIFITKKIREKKQNPWKAEMSILVYLVKMTKSNNNMSVIYHVI